MIRAVKEQPGVKPEIPRVKPPLGQPPVEPELTPDPFDTQTPGDRPGHPGPSPEPEPEES